MKIVSKIQFTTAAMVTSIPIAGEVTVYSKAIKIKGGEYFGVAYKATNAIGDIKLQIDFEVGKQLPTTEGASDTSNYATQESNSQIAAALADSDLHFDSISPVVAEYIRLKITGLADPNGNDADTTLEAWLFQLEEA